MLSILVLVRNTRASAATCMQSLIETVSALALPAGAVEYILVDEFSDPAAGIVDMFKEVRAAAAPSQVRIIRFTSHRHYAYGVAVGMSLARGKNVLFVSHDMIVTPACVKTLLEVVASDASIGVVRPVSSHMDCSRHSELSPSAGTPLRSGSDVAKFSRYVAAYRGLAVEEPAVFVGDAMLITRDAIDRIGVFDTRFFGFMADIDYGVRARRAGLRVVTALGAWLYHEGSGFRKSTMADAGAEAESRLVQQIQLDTAAACEIFRQKWDLTLPAHFKQLDGPHLARLMRMPISFDLRQPPIDIDPQVCEVC